jgi:hypothetical protein
MVGHVTVLPGHSQENLPNLPAAHLYSAGGGVAEFPVSPSLSCGPIGDTAGQHPANQNERHLSPLCQLNRPDRSYVTHIFLLFFTYSKFCYRNIHFMKKMPKESNCQDVN